MSSMLYTSEIIRSSVSTLHDRTAVKSVGYRVLVPGGSTNSHTLAPTNWTLTMIKHMSTWIYGINVNRANRLLYYTCDCGDMKRSC